MTKFIYFLMLISCYSCIKEVSLQPFEDQAFGCQSFTAYKVASNQAATLAVIADRHNLNLTTNWQTFNLDEINSEDLKVVYTSHSNNTQRIYCNDVVNNNGIDWKTTSGSVDIRIKQDSISQGPIGNWHYSIDIQLNNVTFRKGRKEINLNNFSFLDVQVGSIPG